MTDGRIRLRGGPLAGKMDAMSQDPYAGAGFPDPTQPQAPGGYPSSAGSASYPPASYPSAGQSAPQQPAPQQPTQQAYDPGYAPQQYPQSAASAAYAPQGYAPAPAAAPRSPISLMFDFGMTETATPKIGKIVYLGTFVIGILWYIGTAISYFRSAFSIVTILGTSRSADTFSILLGVAFVLLGWIIPVVAAGFVRVFVEFAAATIENTKILKSMRDGQ